VLHVFALEPRGQIVSNVTRPIVAEKPRPLHDGDVVEAGGCECLVEDGRDVGGAHGGPRPAGHDVSGEIVEHSRQIIPAPASDLQVGEVGLPEWLIAVVLSLNSSAAFITT
jgi:hypothetical protein